MECFFTFTKQYMRRFSFLLATLLLVAWQGAKAEVDPNFHIYICFGQSNMEGNAQWETVDNQTVDSRFRMLATTNFSSPQRTMGQWYTAYCPIVSPQGKLGPTDYFGRTMVAAMPSDVRIGVLAVAMGGSPIEMFDKDKYQQDATSPANHTSPTYFSFCMLGEMPTALEELRASTATLEGTAIFYDLQGRRIVGKPTRKGVYISNGRKVLVK